ncbi:hypothetical protein ACV34L_32495, partial [Pseudomonas aeruginosa]
MSKKQILLNAFSMNCVGHINHGLWTHPRDRSSDYRKLRHWTELARLLERSRGWVQRPWLIWPTQFMLKAFRRICFLLMAVPSAVRGPVRGGRR